MACIGVERTLSDIKEADLASYYGAFFRKR